MTSPSAEPPDFLLKRVEEDVSTGEDQEETIRFAGFRPLLDHLARDLRLASSPGTPGFATDLSNDWEWISYLSVEVEHDGMIHLLGNDEVERAAASSHAILALETRFRPKA